MVTVTDSFLFITFQSFSLLLFFQFFLFSSAKILESNEFDKIQSFIMRRCDGQFYGSSKKWHSSSPDQSWYLPAAIKLSSSSVIYHKHTNIKYKYKQQHENDELGIVFSNTPPSIYIYKVLARTLYSDNHLTYWVQIGLPLGHTIRIVNFYAEAGSEILSCCWLPTCGNVFN